MTDPTHAPQTSNPPQDIDDLIFSGQTGPYISQR